MDGETRLFVGAPEALLMHAHYVLGEGWVLRLQLRRQFQSWGEAPASHYERLTTDELEDVLSATLGSVAATEGW